MLIYIAESDQNLRLGWQMLLHQEPGMHVVGLAVRGEGLVDQLSATQADILILDWQLSGRPMNGLLSELQGLQSPPKVVVFSVHADDQEDVMGAGADAFICKNNPPDELLTTLNGIMYGEVNPDK